jgi:hypothetical protein
MVGTMASISLAKRTATTAALAIAIVISQSSAAAAQPAGDSFSSLLMFGVQYGAPERLSASVAGVFPFGKPSRDGSKALEIRGRVGRGGYGVAIGPRLLLYGPVGPEVMLTVTRTFSSPRRAAERSTYVGVEVGYQMLARVSIGVARQIDGPRDRRDTTLTWSVGLEIPWGIWRC